MDKDYTYKKEDKGDHQIELTVNVSKEHFKKEKEKIYARLAAAVEISGFRPGKAPRNLIEARLGPKLFEETLQKVVPAITVDILNEEKITPLTQVKYDIKKIGDDEGIEYVATFAKYPEIKLGDFTKIKLTTEKVEVQEDEITEAIEHLMQHQHEDKPEAKQAETKSEKKEIAEKPAITDESVKALGLGFTTVAELRQELSKRIEEEKKMVAESKRLQQMVEEAVKISNIVVPEVLVKEELEHHEQDYKARIESLGLKVDDFLKAQNTSLDDLKKTWKEDILRKVAQELLFAEVIKKYELRVGPEEIQREVDAITDPKLKGEYDTPDGRRYIATILLQQKALHWLQQQVEPKKEEIKIEVPNA